MSHGALLRIMVLAPGRAWLITAVTSERVGAASGGYRPLLSRVPCTDAVRHHSTVESNPQRHVTT